MKSRYIMEHEKKLMITGVVILSIISIFIIRSCQERQTLRNELELANLSVFIEWFGTESVCNADRDEIQGVAKEMGISQRIMLRSPCAADAMPYAQIWEKTGLTGLEILNQEQANAILTAARFNHIGSLAREDVEALLTGGFPILDDSEFHAERFLNAVTDIDSILRDLEIDINIQESWYALIRGN